MMRSMLAAGIGTLALAACGGSGDTAAPPVAEGIPNAAALDTVIAAERSFAAMSLDSGPRAAFLHYFTDSVITHGPTGPQVGKAHIAAGPDFGPLFWEPELAEASAAGDMGYTTGPIRQQPGAPAGGRYHSVWARQPDGHWQVVLDLGGGHPPDSAPLTAVRRPQAPVLDRTADPAASANELLARDRAYQASYTSLGRDSALALFTFDRVRVFRPRELPLDGRTAALASMTRGQETLAWEPAGARVASSDDFGYTWGQGTIARSEFDNQPRGINYARVWRRDTDLEWRIVLEVVLAHPPAQPQ